MSQVFMTPAQNANVTVLRTFTVVRDNGQQVEVEYVHGNRHRQDTFYRAKATGIELLPGILNHYMPQIKAQMYQG